MAQSGGRACVAEQVTAVAVTVVSHDPLDADAMTCEPGQGPLKEGDGAFLELVRQDLGIGEPAGIIDADVQELPADTAMPVDDAGPPSGDTMADAPPRPLP